MPPERKDKGKWGVCSPRTIIIVIGILALGILFRSAILHQYGFYEPDVFFYYGVMRQTIANGLRIPSPLPYSGFPVHNQFSERPGLIYIPLLLYQIASHLVGSLSLYTFLRWIPMLFGLLEIIAAYILAYQLSKDVRVALLASLFTAIIPASVLRTQATEFRGDTMVPTMLAFLLAIALKYPDVRRIRSKGFVAITLSTGALLGISLLSWIGAVYIIPVLALWAIGVLIYMHTRSIPRAVLITIIVGILFWALGWALLPYVAPGYSSFVAANRYLFKSITETQPANLISLPVWFNVFIILTPLGLLLYLAERKRRPSQDYAYLALVANLTVAMLLVSLQIRWVALAAVPCAVLSASGLVYIYKRLSNMKVFKASAKVIVYSLVAVALIVSGLTVFTQPSASSITPQYLETISWIKNSTPQNSTFMAEWWDGSMIEGLANRTVYVDSVDSGQNATKIYMLSRFLFAGGRNFTFLEETRPDYLMVQGSWAGYYQSLADEGNLSVQSLNGTNFKLLAYSNLSTISGDGATLQRAYVNNDIIVYRVIPGGP